MKIEKNRQILFFVSLIGIIVVTLIMGTTYAYQTVVTEYKEGSDRNMVIEVGKLNVSYENTNRINLTNMTLLPDYKTADYTEFTIKTNDTSHDVAYQINLNELVYTDSLVTDNFKYTLTLIDDNNEYIIGEGDFSNLSGTEINISFNMNTYRILEKGKNETLRLYLWLKENENKENLEKAKFTGNIEIVSLFSNEINENVYKTLKIYGNSVQNGEPTIDNPIEIKSLGTFDETTGKYKIPVTVKSKNLFNLDDVVFSNDTPVPERISNGFIVYHRYAYTRASYTYVAEEDINLTFSYNASIGEGEGYSARVWGKLNSTDLWGINSGYVFNLKKGDKLILNFAWYKPTDYTIVGNESATFTNIQLEEGEVVTDYEPYQEPIIIDVYLDEPLRKVNDNADYIDLINGKVVRNVKVNDSTGTLTIDNSYSALEVPVYKKLDSYNIPYIKDGTISVCTTDLCASDIEVELNK